MMHALAFLSGNELFCVGDFSLGTSQTRLGGGACYD